MKLRGDTHEDHVGGDAGLQFFDLSNPWGHDAPLWPYCPDVKIERFHYMAKSAFPWRWTKGDGCIVRLVAIVDPSGEYRLETGEA